MADDGKAAAEPKVELDEEGKQLQLAAEKAKYRSAIATSRQAAMPSVTSLLPTVADAPKGEVTLVVGGARASGVGADAAEAAVAELAALGVGRGRAADVVARLTGVSRNRLYRGSLQ